ncbi:MAG TPA: PAS domain S-box protein [Spirochaetota bacterium]|nr:PAS domain S-box protein [Spirochaetota bacterium]
MGLLSRYINKLLSLSLPEKDFTHSKVGVWQWDINNDYFNVNRFWYEKLGYEKNRTRNLELILTLIHPDDIENVKNDLDKLLAPSNKKEIDFEIRLKKSDGNWLWVYVNGKIIKYANEKPALAEGILLDITRQKKIETILQNKNSEIEALYEESEAQNEEMAAMMDELQRNQIQLEEANARLSMSEAKFRDIFDKSPIGIIQSTIDGRIISVNNAFCKSFGYNSPEELISSISNTAEFYKDKDSRDKILIALQTENFVFTQDLTGNRKDGSSLNANVYLVRLTDKYTGEDYLTTFVEDITELKSSQLERDLFFNNSGDLMLIHTIRGRIKQANPAWEEILGWHPDELKSINLGHILHPDDIEKTAEFGRLLHKNHTRLNITNRYITKDGEYRTIRWASTLFKDDNLVFSSGRDETERYEAEMELQKMWDRLDLALKSGTIGLWEYNVKENTLAFNSNLAEIVGFSKIDNISSRWKEFIHEDDFRSSAKAMFDLLNGKKDSYVDQYRMLLPDGTYRWIFSRGKIVEYTSSGEPVRIAGSITDITEQKDAENSRLALEYQMLQAQKLESLGLLAGGIAHDFNNLLTGILGNTDMLLYELPDQLPVQQKLIDIRKAAKRASELTRQMLTYSGKSTFKTEIIDLNNLIEEMSSLFDISVSKKVKITYKLDDSIPCITGDPAQISQILMNLVLNASEAIENSGEVKISTSIRECGIAEINSLTLNSNITPGIYPVLDISDNGSGIPQDKIKQIFDPFYTTKFTGRGLGLAAVSGIIRSHNAGLLVESRIDSGTTFRIYFQPTQQQPAEQYVEEKKPVDRQKKNLTVLVADDESYIRTLTSRMLKTAGFDVLLAENGIDAIKIFSENINTIGCIILDLTMPEMDGHEALMELRKINNKLPIIISSGYSEVDITSQFEGENISGFLQKPYQFDELLMIIDRAVKNSGK